MVEDVRDEVEDLIDDVTGEDDVTIVDIAYSPEDVTVDAGTTVTWVNDDPVAHTVTSGSPGDLTGEFSEELSPRDSAEITFDERGTFDYFCEFHPGQMQGTVTVE